MDGRREGWIQRIGRWGLLGRALLLLTLYSLFFALAVPVAALAGWRTAGVAAAGLAALACLISGWLALLVTARWAPPTRPAAHVVLGTGIRMSLPLALCLLVTRGSPWLTEAGFAWFLVAAFGVGLAAETLMSVGQLQSLAVSR